MKLTKFGLKLLCLFILVSFVPFGIAGMVIYKYVYDKTKAEVYVQLRTTAYSLNNQLDLLLSQRRVRVVDFSSDGFIRDSVEKMSWMTNERSEIGEMLNSHLIKNKKSLDDNIIEIEILDKRGNIIASTSIDDIGRNKSHEEYFRTPFLSTEGKGSYFANNLKMEKTGDKLRLVFSHLLKDRIMQSPLGVIVTKVRGSILKDIIGQHMYQSGENGILGPFSEIYIVNSDGRMIESSFSSGRAGYYKIADTGTIKEVLASREMISGIYKNYRGVQVLGTALYVPETGWVILAEKDVKGAFLPLARITHIFVISGICMFFLVFIFAFIISKNLNDIIKKLVQGFKKVEAGNFEHKVTIGKRKDEIQKLVKSFNLMTGKLKESREIQSKFDNIKMLNSLTEKINMGLTLEEVLNYVYEHFRSIIPYDRISIAFITDNRTKVETYWVRSEAEILLDKGFSVKIKETSFDDILRTGTPKITNDMREYLDLIPQSEAVELMVKENMYSNLTCPLIALGKPIGFIFFSSFKEYTYMNVHVELFRQIAGELSLIIEKSRLYQELVELNELKNGFLGMAAHDLRNPNILIRFNLNRLIESLGDIKEEQYTWISRIQNISDSMLVLVNDFLDISAIEAGQLKLELGPISTEVLLKNCFETNRPLSEKKSITLKLDLENELPMVYVDTDRINQALNNLISNAMKYSLPNTEINLRARAIDNNVEVSVSDQGLGIPKDDIHKLFKMFGKAKVRPTAGEKSTGLGLAICKHIMELHGCKIWVESEGMGKGATFKFTLPLQLKENTGKDMALV